MDSLDDIVIITEVADGPAAAGALFRRKFAQEMPDFEHHVVASARTADGPGETLSYLHLWLRDDVCLVGGGCTDGQAIARLPAADRARIRAANGLLLRTLRFSFARYADRCEAFFGYCGDARALAVDLAAGFVPTPHDHLLVHWHRPLAQARRGELVERVRGFGPF
jgi:hypothetical protein